MTPSDQPLPPDALWCTAVAAALTVATERASRLGLAIAEDWRDERGREWAERTALLHRELGRVAAEAADAATALVHRREDVTEPVPGVPLRAAVLGAAAVHDRGPRLGVAAGDRADSGLGMRIAELPAPG